MKPVTSAIALATAIAVALLSLAAPNSRAEEAGAAPGRILSAFFGLNDSRRLRIRALPLCRGVPGRDGNDNNHALCLDVEGEPIGVFFPAGALTDPNEDLNPDTHIAVSTRRSH